MSKNTELYKKASEAIPGEDDRKFVLRQIRNGWCMGYEQAEKDLGWISVKDRLPEEDGRYITCHATCGVPTMVNTSIFFEGRWVLVPEGEIDYWMEIPKLPMEDEK